MRDTSIKKCELLNFGHYFRFHFPLLIDHKISDVTLRIKISVRLTETDQRIVLKNDSELIVMLFCKIGCFSNNIITDRESNFRFNMVTFYIRVTYSFLLFLIKKTRFYTFLY